MTKTGILAPTFEVDGDVGSGRQGDVVVLGLATDPRAQVGPGHLGQGQRVLDGLAVRGLVRRVQEMTVTPPGHFR